MSWVGPTSKRAARTAAKYGPHAVVVWNVAGEHIQAAAKAKAAEIAERRKAFEQADSTAQGSVLKVVHNGTKVFLVFAGDEPVSAYPAVPASLEELVSHADLDKRVTPEQHRERSARARARRASRRVRRKQGPPELK